MDIYFYAVRKFPFVYFPKNCTIMTFVIIIRSWRIHTLLFDTALYLFGFCYRFSFFFLIPPCKRVIFYDRNPLLLPLRFVFSHRFCAYKDFYQRLTFKEVFFDKISHCLYICFLHILRKIAQIIFIFQRPKICKIL